MKWIALLVTTAVLMCAVDKPNLSGTWKMDMDKSDFGGAPPPDSFTRKIEHKEPAIVLTDDQKSALGDDHAFRNYTTDGEEITYQWMGNAVKSAAHWEGAALVIVGKVESNGAEVVITTRLTISEDGKMLIENDKIGMGGSEVAAFKIVLVKQ